MKKSITVNGSAVSHVFVIKDIDVDKITIEKWGVECRSPIEDAWSVGDSAVIEIKLMEKISNTTLLARGPVIEMAAKLGGKIIKDYKTERAKKGHKVYLSGLEFFDEKLEG